MPRRAGVTLTEALVALFVMAIGLLGLLTLFPLGALTMSQAIKDDRCAHAARNAFAIAEAQNLRFDGWVTGYAANASAVGPSGPVYVDPMGIGPLNMPDPPDEHKPSWAAISPRVGNVIPRRSASFCNNTAAIYTWCTMLDDLSFGGGPEYPKSKFPKLEEGMPYPKTPIYREGRYSWAWLLRRPKSINTQVVEVSVVVYYSRGPGASGEYRHDDVTGREGERTLLVRSKPELRRGGWILDATSEKRGSVGERRHGPIHGYFYRVIGVTETSGGTLLDLQTPLKAPVARIVIMQNAAEVFDKGPDRCPGGA